MIDIKADEEKFNYRNRAKEVTVELLNRFDGPDDANENAEEIAKFLSYIVHELSTYNVNVPVSISYQKSTALYNKERDEVIFQKSSGNGSTQKTREVPRRKKHLFTKKWQHEKETDMCIGFLFYHSIHFAIIKEDIIR